MNARIVWGIAALLVASACGEFQPTSLEIVPKGELTVGETTQLEVFAVADDGQEEAVTEKLAFTSSDEAVATVDESGLVTVHARGPLTITATADMGEHGVLEGALGETTPHCEYPAHRGRLGQNEVIPPLSWIARRPTGEPFEFKLEDVYCNAEWRDVKTIHFVFSAGWCDPCSEYARALSPVSAQLRDLGMQIVTIEVDTTRAGQPANTNFAYDHLKRIAEPVAGIAAGDLQTMIEGAPEGGKNFLRNSGFIGVFPTRSIVRTRDMRMIADASISGPWSGYGFPLGEIAADPEADWSKPTTGTPESPGEETPGG